MAKKAYIGVHSYEPDSTTLLLVKGTNLNDASGYKRTITNEGVTVSQSASKFDGSSLYFNGSSRLLVPSFDFFGGDWTIDWWEYPTSSSSKSRFCSSYTTNTGTCGGILLGYQGTKVYASSAAEGSWNIIAGTDMLSTTVNTWTHWAFVKSGTTLTSYRNGVKFASATMNNKVGFSSAISFAIGDYRAGDHNYFIGYMDRFRISNIARWASNFTPPVDSSVARKIVKGYIGVGGVARKIKKAYIGIGGVARPCWSSDPELAYYGAITGLSVARNELAATTVGNYALFGGGSDSDNYSATVDAYNTSLTRSTPTALSVERFQLAATSVGNYALFGGGRVGTTTYSATVDAYNTSLTRSTPTALSVNRTMLAATTVGNYALFGGGYNGYSATVDAYNTSLTRSTPTALSVGRRELTATTVGNYALFGGGYGSSATRFATVDAYNTSLTRSTPTALSVARESFTATTVGNYALFGGGYELTNVVDAYNTSLTRSTPTALSVAKQKLAATTVGNYALFGGGSGSSGTLSATVDAYNASLTRSTPTALSVARYEFTATSVGNYALFGGGSGSSGTLSATVDAYTLIL